MVYGVKERARVGQEVVYVAYLRAFQRHSCFKPSVNNQALESTYFNSDHRIYVGLLFHVSHFFLRFVFNLIERLFSLLILKHAFRLSTVVSIKFEIILKPTACLNYSFVSSLRMRERESFKKILAAKSMQHFVSLMKLKQI